MFNYKHNKQDFDIFIFNLCQYQKREELQVLKAEEDRIMLLKKLFWGNARNAGDR